MQDRKILILDIDGTLVNSEKVITPETLKYINIIQDMGHIVALASGRPYPGMKQYVDALKMDEKNGYIISFNGGKIISCEKGEVVYSNCMPGKYLQGLYDFALEHDMGLVTYSDDMVITGTRLDNYMQYEARLNYMPIYSVEDFCGYVDFDVVKCLMTAPEKQAEECEKILAQRYSRELNVFRSEPYFIEITNKGVDKAKAVENLLNILGIERKNSICCGDGYNDLTMVSYAGVGVAMANAQQIVKDNADYVTGSCDEDGLVEVIKKFILNEERI